MAHSCGALVVESGRLLLPSLKEAAKLVGGVLYVPLANVFPRGENVSEPPSRGHPPQDPLPLPYISHTIRQVYFHMAQMSPDLDLRFILPPPLHLTPLTPPPSLQHKVGVLLSTLPTFSAVQQTADFKLLSQRTQNELSSKFQTLTILENEGEEEEEGGREGEGGVEEVEGDVEVGDGGMVQPLPLLTSYGHVALGGTFDHIHMGHRLLLTESAMLSGQRLLVGVASGPLLESKVLPELIVPCEERVREVSGFLRDVKWWIQHQVVPITDVYGPTAWDGDLQCLVVTLDTARGGEKVNNERKRKGLSPLAIHTAQLVGTQESAAVTREDKLSSSDLRRALLGQHRTPPVSETVDYDPLSGPFLIGLTGAMATGKSSVMARLDKLGAYPIDCDKLGHETYRPGRPAYDQIISEFGEGVVGDGGEVNRRALGAIVFGDKAKLQRLNEIVWPELWRLVEGRVEDAHRHGYKVCVIDAAVLLQAGWHRRVHEVWATIAPPKELVRRVMERNSLPEEAAWRRLSAQPSGREYVDHAHIVIGTQWEPEVTRGQVEGAWQTLMARLNQ